MTMVIMMVITVWIIIIIITKMTIHKFMKKLIRGKNNRMIITENISISVIITVFNKLKRDTSIKKMLK